MEISWNEKPKEKKKTHGLGKSRIWENLNVLISVAHPTITCSKLTIETLEQSMKYVQS